MHNKQVLFFGICTSTISHMTGRETGCNKLTQRNNFESRYHCPMLTGIRSDICTRLGRQTTYSRTITALVVKTMMALLELHQLTFCRDRQQ